MKISVAEIFHSFQGEGPTVGRRCTFLRLAGCNLMCGGDGTENDKKLHSGATWRCDTIEVWRKGHVSTVQEVFEWVKTWNTNRIVITGGEPLLQQAAIVELLTLIKTLPRTFEIEIETNGTIPLSSQLLDFELQFNVSPKLGNSGMSRNHRIKPEVIKKLLQLNSAFKFVVSSEDDVREVMLDYVSPFCIHQQRVFLMPAASSREELQSIHELVADLAAKYNLNLSTRLHLTIWDRATGV